MTAAERLLRYVQFDTQSNEFSDTCPSTDKQKVLALSLVEEMKAMGISDSYMDAEGYVYGTVPGITKDFDDFVRGWIGTSRSYPEGIIHFAPCVDERNIKLFERAFDTLEMFRENGALAGTVIRGLGNRWEQPLSAIFTDLQRREQKISVKEQLKKQSEAKAVRHKKENQQER